MSHIQQTIIELAQDSTTLDQLNPSEQTNSETESESNATDFGYYHKRSDRLDYNYDEKILNKFYGRDEKPIFDIELQQTVPLPERFICDYPVSACIGLRKDELGKTWYKLQWADTVDQYGFKLIWKSSWQPAYNCRGCIPILNHFRATKNLPPLMDVVNALETVYEEGSSPIVHGSEHIGVRGINSAKRLACIDWPHADNRILRDILVYSKRNMQMADFSINIRLIHLDGSEKIEKNDEIVLISSGGMIFVALNLANIDSQIDCPGKIFIADYINAYIMNLDEVHEKISNLVPSGGVIVPIQVDVENCIANCWSATIIIVEELKSIYYDIEQKLYGSESGFETENESSRIRIGRGSQLVHPPTIRISPKRQIRMIENYFKVFHVLPVADWVAEIDRPTLKCLKCCSNFKSSASPNYIDHLLLCKHPMNENTRQSQLTSSI